MQIFEITQRKRTDEGALGALGKIAGGIGRSLADKFVRSTLPGVSIYDEPAQTLPAPTPAAQTTGSASAAATQDTPSWVGTNTNVPAVLRKQKAQQQAGTAPQPAATASVATTTPAAPVTAPATTTPTSPAAAGVVVSPGHRVVVQAANGGKYYKTQKGWTNELGQAVTNAGSIATLEKLADVRGREERIPTMTPPAKSGKPVKTRKRR